MAPTNHRGCEPLDALSQHSAVGSSTKVLETEGGRNGGRKLCAASSQPCFFSFLKNYPNGKNFISQEDCERHLEQLFAQNDLYVFNTFLDENEKCIFHVYLKTKGTFWPTQYQLLGLSS